MAKGNFGACQTVTAKWEGHYSDHAADKGGKTMYGITEAVARRHGWKGEMRDLPRSFANQVYYSSYWLPVNGENLAYGVDLSTYDFGVNSGPSRANNVLLHSVGGSDAETIRKINAYRRTFVRNIGQAVFLKGWLNRINDVEARSLAMEAKYRGADPGKVLREEAETGKKEAAKDAGKGGAGGMAGGFASWSVADIFGVVMGVVVVAGMVYFGYQVYKKYKRSKAMEAVALEMEKEDDGQAKDLGFEHLGEGDGLAPDGGVGGDGAGGDGTRNAPDDGPSHGPAFR